MICRILNWFKSRFCCVNHKQDLKKLMRKIMANQAEIVAQLKGANQKLAATTTQLVKVGTETDSLQQKIVELQAIIDAGGTIGQDLIDAANEVSASADAVSAAAKGVDDKVPDAPPTEPPTQPPTNPDNP